MHGVAAGIHEGAAGQFELPADVVALEQRKAHPGLDALHLAQLPAPHDLDHALGQRVIAPVKGSEQVAQYGGAIRVTFP